MAQSSNGGSFLTGMVVGAAAGAALALLYTPRSRRALALLRDRGIDVEQLSRSAFQGQRQRLEQALEEGKRAAERTRTELLQRYQSRISGRAEE